MPFCRECGAQISESATLCPACGAKVGADAQGSASPPGPATEADDRQRVGQRHLWRLDSKEVEQRYGTDDRRPNRNQLRVITGLLAAILVAWHSRSSLRLT
jgi:predicted amidophosphoribosyltransferase